MEWTFWHGCVLFGLFGVIFFLFGEMLYYLDRRSFRKWREKQALLHPIDFTWKEPEELLPCGCRGKCVFDSEPRTIPEPTFEIEKKGE